VEQLTRLLLYFVAAYCLFDTLTIVFSSTLKGAGDTRFVMIISLSMGWGVMFLPSWIMVRYFGMGVFTAWSFLTACVVLMGFTFLARFLRGAWRDMRVIEQAPGSTATPPTELPDAPTVDPTI
jgi:MATE family multidrug resistance protein